MTANPLPAQRIQALDIFRGLTIAFMIIVNTPGNGDRSWGPLQHAPWHGFTPTDLVFPSFLFIIGVSAWFSFKKFDHQPGREVLLKIWRRTAIIFVTGLLLWHVPGFFVALFSGKLGGFFNEFLENVRILGVLQRLALCYGIGSTMALFFSQRALIAAGAALLVSYWGLMWMFGQGADAYSLQTNAVLRLDLWLMGPQHLYHGDRVAGLPFAFDPEGGLSTLPAIGTFIIGYMTGRFLDLTRDRRLALSELFPIGVLLIIAGLIWSEWLGFPLNKKLWTSSFVLYAGGLSLLVFCLTIWLVDVKGRAGFLSFFRVFGLNPLLAYVASEMLVVILFTFKLTGPDGAGQFAYPWLYARTTAALAGDTAVGSFLFALGYMLVIWLMTWVFYKRGIFLKI
jgi:predicted acyltransferase